MNTQPKRDGLGELVWRGHLLAPGRNAYNVLARDGYTILASVQPQDKEWVAFINGERVGSARLKSDAQRIVEAAF